VTGPALPASLLARARADQVDQLYRQWHRTTASMVFGALLLCTVLWGHAPPEWMAAWFAAILANQAWRGVLTRAYRRARPAPSAAPRWGRRWALGSTVAGSLWGVAAVAMYPASPAHEALLIVCLFGVVMGGLNLTAVWSASFYGFVTPALVPLIVRVALEGDRPHLFTALVMGIVLGFVLAYGRELNGLLTASLAMRHENLDLIGELQAQTRAADSARAAAETANRAKSHFLAAASHDLRQPLHALGLFAAALAARTRTTDVAPLVQSIRASVEALEGLFAQLLDLSRLDAGALTPRIGAVALAPLFARVAADVAPQAAASGLVLRVAPTTLAVQSDPVLLERIVRNFAANALAYTRAGGVLLGARRVGGAVRIDVVDTGIGIAPADRDRIFDEFVQAAPGMRPHTSGRGLGLGLAIVRRLASLLRHPLETASVPGRGSRFYVRAPSAATAPGAPGAPVRDRAAAGPGDLHLPGRRVIVVDDDDAVVAAMVALFDAWGATVVTAGNAASAVAALDDCGVDLIVADLRLSDDASGVDAVRWLRRVLGRPTPALIVSGDLGEEAHREAHDAGLPLLAKPLVADALALAVRRALAAPVAASSPGELRPGAPAA
jgi:signal transduction histidine kinase/ActR/RegA family two-component response regulator